jgi:hypothetical protein
MKQEDAGWMQFIIFKFYKNINTLYDFYFLKVFFFHIYLTDYSQSVVWIARLSKALYDILFLLNHMHHLAIYTSLCQFIPLNLIGKRSVRIDPSILPYVQCVFRRKKDVFFSKSCLSLRNPWLGGSLVCTIYLILSEKCVFHLILHSFCYGISNSTTSRSRNSKSMRDKSE